MSQYSNSYVHSNIVAELGKNALPLLISVIVGICSAIITSNITMARLEERMVHVERWVTEHTKDTAELRTKDIEYERRISRMESLAENNQRRLDEIGADVKTLLTLEREKP